MLSLFSSYSFFFFNDTATTEIYTLSLHDALPISALSSIFSGAPPPRSAAPPLRSPTAPYSRPDRSCRGPRSEEHTSELQSRLHLVCRLLLEKKKKQQHLKKQTSTHQTRSVV